MAEFVSKTEIHHIPANTRGIYALLKETKKGTFDVVYIGLSAGEKAGMSSRMRAHHRKKGVAWTHLSIFEVHDNINNDEIHELEGLFRHIYRKDTKANRLNRQQRYKKFKKVTTKGLKNWKQGA